MQPDSRLTWRTVKEESERRYNGMKIRNSQNSMANLRKRESIEGYLFVAPLLVGVIVFTAGVMPVSLAVSGGADTHNLPMLG
jgi:hypothetical protein